MNEKEAYSNLVLRKLRFQASKGLDVQIKTTVFSLIRLIWSDGLLRRGRAAIFADTGLGKKPDANSGADTVCRETGGDVLILALLLLPSRR